MEREKNISRADVERKYDFTGFEPGDSVWARTHNERVAIVRAFKAWKGPEANQLEVTSQRVDMDDPKGAGYRVFFEPKEAEQPLSAMAKQHLLTMEIGIHNPKWFHVPAIFPQMGLFTNDDIIDAVRSTGTMPKTLAEVNRMNADLVWGRTPKQIAYCKEKYGMVFEEKRRIDEREWDQRQQREDAKRAQERLDRGIRDVGYTDSSGRVIITEPETPDDDEDDL